MKYCIIIFFLSIELVSRYPGTEWRRYYGNNHGARSVCQTSDGGFVLTGYAERYNMYILKIDSYGDSLWARNYSDSGWGTGYCIEQTIDGGFIIAGSSQGEGCLMKTDSMGFAEWWKGYKCGGSTAWCVDQTEDGGYIAVGGEGSYLLKTDADGDSLWAKGYGGDAKFCQQTSDGGYIVTGGKDNDVYLVKTDSMGDSVWARKYGGDIGFCVKETSDEGYIITGSKGDYEIAYLVKVDSLGDTLWTKELIKSTSGGVTAGRSVCETPDSGFIIAGQEYDKIDDEIPIYSDYLWIMKTDFEGNKIWVRKWGALGCRGFGYSVQNTIDCGYVVAGIYERKLAVIKIKSDDSGIEEDNKLEQKDFSLLGWNLIPFGYGIEIQYEIHKETDIRLEVYNMLGQEIVVLVDEKLNKGFYTETWYGKDKYGHDLSSGVYFLKLETPGFKKTGKIFLLR